MVARASWRLSTSSSSRSRPATSGILDVFYVCAAGDTLNSIATIFTNRVNALANPEVAATGPANPALTSFAVASGPNVVAAIDDATMYTSMIKLKSKLHAVIAGNIITFQRPRRRRRLQESHSLDQCARRPRVGFCLQPSKNTPVEIHREQHDRWQPERGSTSPASRPPRAARRSR